MGVVAGQQFIRKYRPGMKVGSFTVLSKTSNASVYKIRCECGYECERRLRDGVGCKKCHHKNRIHDLTGRKFGKWRVLRMLPTQPGKKGTRCEARCGLCKKVYNVACRNLSAGLTRKCRPCSERISREITTSRSEQAIAWRAACKP